MLKSLSVRTVLALVAGLVAGAAIGAYGSASLVSATETFESVGALWLNALRMTVIPLVFSLLVTGIASVADAVGRG